MDTSSPYDDCRLCPFACGVDRHTALGRCGEGADLRLAFAGLHCGEEPPFSGSSGSGTIFVSGCNLGCPLCQNWQISRGEPGSKALGRSISPEEFAALCLELQNRGAENINIVTGSHAAPALARGLLAARAGGLRIPALWNSSGYEGLVSLEILEGYIDIWLPDLKTLDSDLAARFFRAPDYPQVASEAIRWMLARPDREVMIRHLILPAHLESTRSVLRWFADNAAPRARLSLMSQYTPIRAKETSPIGPGRYLSRREYDTVLGWLGEFGISEGFCQDFVTGSDWLPDFRRPNPFPSALSVPVWHYEGEFGNRTGDSLYEPAVTEFPGNTLEGD